LSTSSLIIRPSKISAVVAEEMEESVKTTKQKPVKKRVEKIKEVDIITDAD
jgi:predicted transcriptional regulator